MSGRRPLVKVCGLTRAADVAACLDLGVDLTGFIFAAKSPRRVTPEACAALPRGRAARVGVFIGQSADEVRAIMDAAGLDLAQLHGGQDEEFCRRVGPERVIKVFWPDRHPDRAALEAELSRFAGLARYVLCDAGTSGGGHGKTMDFGKVAGLVSPCPWFLAGGLSPDNLGLALSVASPGGVDLNSGLETAPGVKSPALIEQALQALAT